MKSTFLNHEPKRSVMKQFCDLLRNIVDHKVDSSLYHIIALSFYREIAISQYRDIAGMPYMKIFVNLFSAKCDLRYVSSHIDNLRCFDVSFL